MAESGGLQVFLNQEAERERLNNACMMGDGHKEPENKTTSTASGSISASATKDARNKVDKMKGHINLTQEFEEAAGHPADMQDEPELLLDVPPQPAPQAAPTQASEGDFWQKMNYMLDVKFVACGQDFGKAMQAVENRLGTEIQKEREERNTESNLVDERIEAVMTHLEKLECRTDDAPGRATPTPTQSAPTWEPRLLILGGWPEKATRAQLEEDSQGALKKLPEQLQRLLLQPYAPNNFGEIANGAGGQDPLQLLEDHKMDGDAGKSWRPGMGRGRTQPRRGAKTEIVRQGDRQDETYSGRRL